MLRRSQFEELATVKMTGDDGEEVVVSAVLQRDPHYLKWNRMFVLGRHDEMMAAMRLQGDPIKWEVHRRSDGLDADRKLRHTRTGTGLIQTVGMASGVSIAEDTIQQVAEISLAEIVDSSFDEGLNQKKLEYWFLQRSRDWPIYARAFQALGPKTLGKWYKVNKNLKFRLITVNHLRDDDRVSQETEMLRIPGVEISPVYQTISSNSFSEEAKSLWFSFRIMLMFGLRQYINTLAELENNTGMHRATWHAMEIKPREITDEFHDRPFFARLETVLAKGAARLLSMEQHKELMHAAVYGYADSFRSLTLESGLTSCVEGIERLVSAFEVTNNLSREVVEPRKWKLIAKSLKGHVSDLELAPPLAARIKRGLAAPVNLSLQERIERMGARYSRNWKGSKELLDGVDRMVRARNDIVHARLIDDPNIVFVERTRARGLFEKLFLSFVGCGSVETSGYANSVLFQHYGN